MCPGPRLCRCCVLAPSRPPSQTSGNESDADDRHGTLADAEQFVGKKVHVYTLPKEARSVRLM